LTIYEMKLM